LKDEIVEKVLIKKTCKKKQQRKKIKIKFDRKNPRMKFEKKNVLKQNKLQSKE
jgi:hypothetical protein